VSTKRSAGCHAGTAHRTEGLEPDASRTRAARSPTDHQQDRQRKRRKAIDRVSGQADRSGRNSRSRLERASTACQPHESSPRRSVRRPAAPNAFIR